MFIGVFWAVFFGKYVCRVFFFVFEGENVGGVGEFFWYVFL